MGYVPCVIRRIRPASVTHIGVVVAAALLSALTATAWTSAGRHTDQVVASITRPTVAAPSGRYTDLVFASAAKSTATYGTAPALVGGAPTTLRLDVYQPVGDTLPARPAIVWIHGGGFVGGRRSYMAGVATAYARRGYVTFSIDYRVDSGSRCQAVQDGDTTDPAQVARCTAAIQAAQDDALDAIRWVRDHAATYRIDTTRVAVGGSSAGAVTAINVAQKVNPTHGVVRDRIKVGAALAMSGCNYDLSSIDANDAPISMLHAGHDIAVPYACARATVNRAKSFGIPARRIFYPAESGHGMALYDAHRVTVDASWCAFLKARLGLP